LEYLNFDIALRLAQGGESFDFAQDREPVERLAEPFCISNFLFRILIESMKWYNVNPQTAN
jgi:hypothetical protein